MKHKCACGGTIRKFSSPKPGAVQIGSRLSTPIVLTHACEKCDTQYGVPRAPTKEKQTNGDQ